jgi:catechol 2,3-dioxygenase-like lactoylglutathione lyase family enzyme
VSPALTHVAFGVRDLAQTIAFYRKHVRLHVVHEREEHGSRVVWLGERTDDPSFVLVFFEVPGEGTAGRSPLQHLGFALASRDEVNAAADAARTDGILVLEPVYAGPIVGYFCIVRDPDGVQVEFSHGQPINPRQLPQRDA